jgi:putative phosphoribosyl transferase
MPKFENRHSAGKLLAEVLMPYAERRDVIVLGLPRGGVPVAYEIAKALHLPLDVFIVRKLGVPNQSEYAMGAIAMNNITVLNNEVVREMRITHNEIDQVLAAEQQELKRREKIYRHGRQPLNVTGKIIILVDDGIATGASMRVAVRALRTLHPAFIIIAVPVVEKSVLAKLALAADKVVCLAKPVDFKAVGAHYEDFEQTNDQEVLRLLADIDLKGRHNEKLGH